MKSSHSEIHRCRLCGFEKKPIDLQNIFESNQELEKKIEKLLPIVVLPWDPLSHEICKNCVDKLNYFDKFYGDVMETDRYLRTFFPSASTSEIENIDPIIRINDSVRTFRNSLKLPPKNYSKHGTNCSKIEEEIVIDSDGDKTPGPVESPKKTLDSFIVNPITRTESVFTCRKCFRTFTKELSALTHSCINTEKVDINDEKSILPCNNLSISTESTAFQCNICNIVFDSKTDERNHQKIHHLLQEMIAKNRKSKSKIVNFKTKRKTQRRKKILSLHRKKPKSPLPTQLINNSQSENDRKILNLSLADCRKSSRTKKTDTTQEKNIDDKNNAVCSKATVV